MKNSSYKSPSFRVNTSEEVDVSSKTKTTSQNKYVLNREYFSQVLIYSGLLILISGLLSIFNTEYHLSSMGVSAIGFLLFAFGLILYCTSTIGPQNADGRDLRRHGNFNV